MPVITKRTGFFQKMINKYIGGFLISNPFLYFFAFDMSNKKFTLAFHHFCRKGLMHFMIGVTGFGNNSFTMFCIIFVIHICAPALIKNCRLHITDFFYAQ